MSPPRADRSALPADATVVVVGAGLAAHSAATALRTAGHAGPVVLLGAEAHLPYDRPPLSKQVLLADDVADGLAATTLPALPDDVEVRRGVRATGLRPGTVETDAGDVGYDALVVATGAAPLRLPGDGRPAHGAHPRGRARTCASGWCRAAGWSSWERAGSGPR